MHTGDGKSFSNISATTSDFTLLGGLYGATAVATWSAGSAKLQRLAADGTTYLSVSSGTDFTANGYATVYLPYGTYRITVATSTAIYIEINRIPME